jgi:hypothetical protein
MKKKKRKAGTKTKFSYYQVISSNKKFNYGAFPPDKGGYESARHWANKMTEETGTRCVVRKK